MKGYQKMLKNYETIKEFIDTYYDELKVIGALLGEKAGLFKYSDYMKFIDQLTKEEVYGNYLVNLLNDNCIDSYKMVLNNEIDFETFLMTLIGYDDELYSKYTKKINKLKAQV